MQDKNLAVLTEYGVAEGDLFEDAREALKWVKSYLKVNDDWPTIKMLQETTGIIMPVDDEKVAHVADQVRKRRLGLDLSNQLQSAARQLEERDPDSALKIIQEFSLRSHAKRESLVSHRASANKRVALYDAAKAAGGLIGIRTPWDTLNTWIQGWVDGTLNVIMGMQGCGKTWCLTILANHCLNYGKRVLFVTMEMDTGRIQRRLDAVRYKIPFGGFRDASLDMTEEARWKVEVKKDEVGVGDVMFADKKLVERVHDVTSLVYEYRPDIVLIDGGYRFKGTGASHWESTASIVGDLQAAAEMTGVPWVVTTQYGDAAETGKEKKRGPKMRAWGVRYGKEWVINPDVAIGVYQSQDLRLMQRMEIHALKMREATGTGKSNVFQIKWDHDMMEFNEIDDEEGSPDVGEVIKSEVEF